MRINLIIGIFVFFLGLFLTGYYLLIAAEITDFSLKHYFMFWPIDLVISYFVGLQFDLYVNRVRK